MMLITQALLDRLPNWVTVGWAVNDEVNWGDWNNQCSNIETRILNNDSFASFVNEHPPHKPS
jgi:hypothetical protein